MTEKEILNIEQGYSESKIQHTCVCWFRDTFPHMGPLLFAVPNGGWRGARAGAQMVYEGQVKGVADLILLHPSGSLHALCVEMKTPRKKDGRRAGAQSREQKEWQRLVSSYGNAYHVCRGLMEFIEIVCSYLGEDTERLRAEALTKYPMYR